jgi:class 3 adenylate cyclase/YHS domain-containing protein
MFESKKIDIVLLVADLSGYTALTEAHGNISAAKVVHRYNEIAQESLYEGSRLIERVGDEILIAGTDAASIIKTALKLVNKIETEPFFPTVHAGIHAGKVLEQEGQYFGSALNIASRVASHARGCQILCTKAVAEIAGEMEDIKYKTIGEVNFKNIFEPVALFEIITDCQKLEANVVDPVCRMLVRPESSPAHLTFKGNCYYFCSFECAERFTNQRTYSKLARSTKNLFALYGKF